MFWLSSQQSLFNDVSKISDVTFFLSKILFFIDVAVSKVNLCKGWLLKFTFCGAKGEFHHNLWCLSRNFSCAPNISTGAEIVGAWKTKKLSERLYGHKQTAFKIKQDFPSKLFDLCIIVLLYQKYQMRFHFV